jgi:hypothetical protein
VVVAVEPKRTQQAQLQETVGLAVVAVVAAFGVDLVSMVLAALAA